MASKKPRHFTELGDIPAAALKQIIANAHAMKKEKYSPPQILQGLSLAMMFDKRSTRTRVSFEVAMKQLGGHTVILNQNDILLSLAESLESTTKVFSRYVDAIMARVSSHEALQFMAENATIPVINGMTDFCHPCQVMADVMTIEEKLGGIEGKKVVWLGDYNNMSHTFVQGAEIFGYQLTVSCPEDIKPLHPSHLDVIRTGGKNFKNVRFEHDPEKAVAGADVLVTDTWVSQGQEKDKKGEAGIKKFQPWQVTAKLMALAAPHAIFMHCLPIHEWEEVTEEVAKSPASVIYDEAENRLHAQKAILAWCLEEAGVSVGADYSHTEKRRKSHG